jgi:hypothetical protein
MAIIWESDIVVPLDDLPLETDTSRPDDNEPDPDSDRRNGQRIKFLRTRTGELTGY